MANKFQLKRTTITGRTPNTTNSANTSFIDAGELAINLTDGILYSSNGTVSFEVGANLSSLKVCSNVVINCTSLFIGNSTVNVVLTSSTLDLGTILSANSTTIRLASNTFFANSSVVKINVNDTLTFNDSTTQNTAFRVYDSAGTRIA